MIFTTLSINMDNTDKINDLLKDVKFKKFTKEQAVEALNAYYNIGLSEASKITNIPKRKILDWLNPGRNAKYCQAGLENNYEKRQKRWQSNYKENAELCKSRMKEIRKNKEQKGALDKENICVNGGMKTGNIINPILTNMKEKECKAMFTSGLSVA